MLLLRPDPAAPAERMVATVVDGPGTDGLRGVGTPIDGSLAGRVFRTGVAESVADVRAADTAEPLLDGSPGYGTALFVPLGEPDTMGVLVAANRPGAAGFSTDATEVTIAFAGQAALALRLAEAQRAQQQVALYADRHRIAQDLHDQVIQRLFATGMALQSIVGHVPAANAQAKLHRAVDELDQSIHDIRGTIFALQTTRDGELPLRQRLAEVVEAATAGSALDLSLQIRGPVETVLPLDVSAHAMAVLREAVTNVVRHARAGSAAVTVVAGERLRIEVTDNGVGYPAGGSRSGLANLADRAQRLGGTLELDRDPVRGGARLVWDVPLP